MNIEQMLDALKKLGCIARATSVQFFNEDQHRRYCSAMSLDLFQEVLQMLLQLTYRCNAFRICCRVLVKNLSRALSVVTASRALPLLPADTPVASPDPIDGGSTASTRPSEAA